MPERAFVYDATAVRVIDGDTLICRVDLGFNVDVNVTVRLHGVNAPEHNRPGGKDATRFLDGLVNPLVDAVRSTARLRLQSFKDAMSFARWVCDVWILEPDGTESSIADLIVAAGHGTPFDPAVDKWHR
jgi:endonuclease YncB( thermonuclease family)